MKMSWFQNNIIQWRISMKIDNKTAPDDLNFRFQNKNLLSFAEESSLSRFLFSGENFNAKTGVL